MAKKLIKHRKKGFKIAWSGEKMGRTSFWNAWQPHPHIVGVNINLANDWKYKKGSKLPHIVVAKKIEKKSLIKTEEENNYEREGKLIGIGIHRKMTSKLSIQEYNLTIRQEEVLTDRRN